MYCSAQLEGLDGSQVGGLWVKVKDGQMSSRDGTAPPFGGSLGHLGKAKKEENLKHRSCFGPVALWGFMSPLVVALPLLGQGGGDDVVLQQSGVLSMSYAPCLWLPFLSYSPAAACLLSDHRIELRAD